MPLEIEQKYRVTSLAPTEAALREQGATLTDAVTQVDCYYAHPQRDFAQTDEAFRIRAVGPKNFLTYKGPKLDQTTKSRVEYEVAVAEGPDALAACGEILRNLGFTPASIVRKQRRICELTRDGFTVEVALDDVRKLGTFVELEIGVSDETTADAAKAVLAKLAAELNLSDVERRSYLELVIASRQQ
ncbi:MAG: class IV adenylate cyclase [Bythopirellula sp.]|nr:class IV adenylate cyclase [Bythopirellula sp.]